MDALATVLVRRLSRVSLPAGSAAPEDAEPWVSTLEADLAERGWLLDARLRARFTELTAHTRMLWADWLLALADEWSGADRRHLPLYRQFPDTPAEPAAVFVNRLLAELFQAPDAPCVLCGDYGDVNPVSPCGHLVCATCFDPADYTACAICGRRGDGSFLKVAKPRRAGRPKSDPVRWKRLTLDETPKATAVRLRDDLVVRPTALSEADAADLRTLIEATALRKLDWLPDTVPARETLALVLAWALPPAARLSAYPEILRQAVARWTTATDAARCLWAYSGGDAGLIVPRPEPSDGPDEGWRPWHEPKVTVAVPRVSPLPRAMRRAVLAFLDGLDLPTLAEDLARHRTVWKRLAERLHPFEQAGAHPRAAVAFAALRQTRTPIDGLLGFAIAEAAAEHPDRVVPTYHPGGLVSVRVRTFASLVEAAVAADDVVTATALLAGRPGDLWRRLDHLLRLAADDPDATELVLDTAVQTAARVSPTVLAGAFAELHGRDATVAVRLAQAQVAARGEARQVVVRYEHATPELRGPLPGTPRRTFFPKGDVVRTWTEPEYRKRLAATTVTQVRTAVDVELTRRAAAQGRFDVAVIDAALGSVPAPSRERAGSEQLAGWPRGSFRALGDADVLRLFLHWMDGPTFRVDLDLSCAFYDADWEEVGHCDYTRLRFGKRAAIHSGDLTSAPPPGGATEYLDLDRPALRAAGVTWAVPVVFSYNDVPFEALTSAFAGFSLPLDRKTQFDPARVLQRFTLRGNAKALLPMILQVETGTVMWADASLTSPGYAHRIGNRGPRLGRVAADLWEHFDNGKRASLLDLVAWHAAARADRVLVAYADGTAAEVPTGSAEAIRAAALLPAGSMRPGPLSGCRILAAATGPDRLTAYAGPDAAPGSVAVLVDGIAGPPWTALAAADLAAPLGAQ
ncbi:hypothetical protein HDA40_002551 [Hamadaea flava]|uniref:MXAN_6230/SCO0854 family RING domain-containing protein n=1 Tax=Hamadaea flava TaxID=1742688 RepID=A0ABV8LM82_9ACTN|nr:MXAN_6230/SCO0854 family RING domain-containing protein [Hamadaea flava]MCP2324044.1 hypothetical protein [Hamadaea flava]